MRVPLFLDFSKLDFEKGDGLVTVIAQDATTGAVLMLAHADRGALEQTIETGEMHYRSRSRGLWRKGATSGNIQRVISLYVDCDGDAVLARVTASGPACHNGWFTCFGEGPVATDVLSALSATIAERAKSSDETDAASRPSYTKRLLSDRNLRLKKIGEEAAELIVALADRDRARAAEEGADLIFHMLVGLHDAGVSLDDLRHVLAMRAVAPSDAPPN